MSRQMEQMVTMAIMLMTTTAMLVILHVLRVVLHEDHEWPTITSISLVLCGVGMGSEILLMAGAHKRKKKLIMVYCGFVVARACCHTLIAVVMMILEQSYEIIVMGCYMILFSIALAFAAWRAKHYESFLASGQRDVDEHPVNVGRRKVPFKDRRLMPAIPESPSALPPSRRYPFPARTPTPVSQESHVSRGSRDSRGRAGVRRQGVTRQSSLQSSPASSPSSSSRDSQSSSHTRSTPSNSSTGSSTSAPSSPPLIVHEPNSWVHSPPKPWQHPTFSRHTAKPTSNSSLSPCRTYSPDRQKIRSTSYASKNGKSRVSSKSETLINQDGFEGRKKVQRVQPPAKDQGDIKAVTSISRVSVNHRKKAASNLQNQAHRQSQRSFQGTTQISTELTSQHLGDTLSVQSISTSRSRETLPDKWDILPSSKEHLKSKKAGKTKQPSSHQNGGQPGITKHTSKVKIRKRGYMQGNKNLPHTCQRGPKLMKTSSTMNTYFGYSGISLIVTKLGSAESCKNNFTGITTDKEMITSTNCDVESPTSEASKNQKESAASRRARFDKLIRAAARIKYGSRYQEQHKSTSTHKNDNYTKGTKSLQKEEFEELQRITKNFVVQKNHSFDLKTATKENAEHLQGTPRNDSPQSVGQQIDDSELENELAITEYVSTESLSTDSSSLEHEAKRPEIGVVTLNKNNVTLRSVKKKKNTHQKHISPKSSKSLSEPSSPKQNSSAKISPKSSEVDVKHVSRPRKSISDLWKDKIPRTRLVLSGEESDSLTTFEATKIRAIIGLADRQRQLIRQLKVAPPSDSAGDERIPDVKGKKVRKTSGKPTRKGRARK